MLSAQKALELSQKCLNNTMSNQDWLFIIEQRLYIDMLQGCTGSVITLCKSVITEVPSEVNEYLISLGYDTHIFENDTYKYYCIFWDKSSVEKPNWPIEGVSIESNLVLPTSIYKRIFSLIK